MRKHATLLAMVFTTSILVMILLIFPVPFLWLKILACLLVTIITAIYIQKMQNASISTLQIKVEELKKVINQFDYEVQVASSQISSVSEHLSITLDENNSFAQQLYAEAKEMADLNTEVNENIHSTLSGVKNIVELLEEAGGMSYRLEEKSLSSNEVIKNSLSEIMEIVDTINGIQESTNGTMENMDKLNTTSKEIIHILEAVNDIAKHTQLLALNASIESARAGEAGRGFGVVADEIGKLALNTSLAVKDVNRLINSIQQEIKSVFDIVKENSSRVENGVKVSGNIGVNLGKIDNSFGEVLDVIKKLNEITKKEEVLTKDISEKIESVEKTVQSTSQSVEEVKESVHKQKHSIEEIADMGSRLNDASKSLIKLISETDILGITSGDKEAIDKAVDSFKGISGKLMKDTNLLNMNKETHKELLENLISGNEFIEAAWTNDYKGRFICSIPEAGIANAGVREWFKQSILGIDYISSVYISAITKNPCITISTPIRKETGDIIGVLGIDIKLGGNASLK